MSKIVPRPESLVQGTVEVLREQIEAGRFGTTLPGEPRLASQLMVSRGTLRKALETLAGEKWISAGGAGKSRRVLVASPDSEVRRSRSVGVLIPSSLDALPSPTQHFLRDLAAITAPDGITFDYHHSAAIHRTRPGRLLQDLLAEHPTDLWLLYEASKPVARFFKSSGTPAIICGGPALDEGVSMCGFDGSAAIRHAIGVFSRAGHTRIVAPSRYPRPRREQIIREEFEKRGLAFDSETHMPLWENDLDQLHELLCSRLTGPNRPTAWIISGLNGLIVFFSTLMELGLRIPQDVSLLTIGSDPMLGCFRPTISHYSSPHRALALAMARMIRTHLHSPPSAPIVKLLETEFVRGGSVGPVEG